MSNLSHYRQWLVDQGYQLTTITTTLRHLQVVADNPEKVGYRGSHVRRYLLYVATTKRHPLGRHFTTRMTRKHGLEAVSETRKKGGGNIKELLDGGQWYTLHQVLRQGSQLDKLILAYMESPYRIRKFLDMRIRDVGKDDVQHTWSRKWISKMYTAQVGTIRKNARMYQILCPSASCAYSRMRRRLIVVAKELGFDVDLDTLHKTFHKRAAAC